MQRKFYFGFAALVLMVALIGCRSISPAASAPPDPPAGGVSLLSEDQRAAARQIYVGKCARCHKFYDPAKYPDTEWRDWMKKMSRKAKLKPEQEKLLVEYLELYRVRTNGPVSKQEDIPLQLRRSDLVVARDRPIEMAPSGAEYSAPDGAR